MKVSKDLFNHVLRNIPNLKFFNKEGYMLNTTMHSTIEFEFVSGNYVCMGFVNLFPDIVPELIIREQINTLEEDETLNQNSLTFYLNHHLDNEVKYVVPSVDYTYTLENEEVYLSSDKPILTHVIKEFKILDSLLDEPLYKTFIDGNKIEYPTIVFHGEIDMEEVSTSFISNEVINILQEKVKNGKSEMIEPFSDYVLKIEKDDEGRIYSEVPQFFLNTNTSNATESFVIKVNYKTDTLERLPYQLKSANYGEKSFENDVRDILSKEHIGFEKLTPRFKEVFDSLDINNVSLTQDQGKSISFLVGCESKEEGYYKNKVDMYIMFEDVYFDKVLVGEEVLNHSYPIYIGSFILNTNIIGIDDRYRTFFTNFGLPDPITYSNIFKDIDVKEDFTNAPIINEKSKELYLTYDKIFPYVGTYKALLNAVNFLGYSDLFFREWYKTVDQDKYNKNETLNFIGLDVNEGLTLKDKLKFANIDFETYLNLKKLNKLSMVYRMNKESEEVDEYGVPRTIDVYDYTNDEVLIKLFAVREWLERYIIGVNTQITDITGEGIYFQRFESVAYTNTTQIIEGKNSAMLSPIPLNSANLELSDKDLSVNIEISLADFEHTSFQNIGLNRIRDFVKYIVKIDPKSNSYETNSDIDEWDENDMFSIPISSPLSIPSIIDNVTYNLELNKDKSIFASSLYGSAYNSHYIEGNIINSLELHKLSKEEYDFMNLEAISNGFYEDVYEEDLYNFIKDNKIDLDKDTRESIYSKFFDYKNSQKNGEEYSIPLPIEISEGDISMYNTKFNSVFYKQSSLPHIRIKSGIMEYEDRIKSHSLLIYIKPTIQNNNIVFEALHKDIETEKEDKLLSSDYFSLVPKDTKNSECKFEYADNLGKYAFKVKNYKLISIGNEEFNKTSNIPSLLEKDVWYIVEIYDGTIVSKVKDPISIKNGFSTYLTEQIDFEQYFDNKSVYQNDVVVSPIYNYVVQNVPLFAFKKNIDEYTKVIFEQLKTIDTFYNENKVSITKNIETLKNKLNDERDRMSNLDDVKKTREDSLKSFTENLTYETIYDIVLDEENLVVNDKIIIVVNHIGDYRLEAFGYDDYNNVYHSIYHNPISVFNKDKDILIGAPNQNSNNDINFYDFNMQGKNIEEALPISISNKLIKDNKNEQYKFLFGYKFGIELDDYTPEFEKFNSVYDLAPYEGKPKTIKYDIQNFNFEEGEDKNFVSFSNVTDSVIKIEPFSDIDDMVYDSEGYKSVNVRLYLNPSNSYKLNVYDEGTKFKLVAINEQTKKEIGELGEFELLKTTDIYNDELYKTIEAKINIHQEDNVSLNLYKQFIQLSKTNKFVKFYFIRTSGYTLVDYYNDYENRSAKIKIKAPKPNEKLSKEKFLFNKGDIIKVRSSKFNLVRTLKNQSKENILKLLNLNTDKEEDLDTFKSLVVYDIVPQFTETAYKVIDDGAYGGMKDSFGTYHQDKEYQIFTINGFLDWNRFGKTSYDETINGSYSSIYDKIISEREKNRGYEPIYNVPFPYNSILNTKIDDMQTNFDQMYASGNTVSETQLRYFYLQYRNRDVFAPNPNKPVYTNTMNIVSADGKSELRYISPNDSGDIKNAHIVFIKKDKDDNDDFLTEDELWFESLIEKNDFKLEELYSFINNILGDLRLMKVEVLHANTSYVRYPFLYNGEDTKGRYNLLSVIDPYSIFDYIDGNYSMIVSDFDIETAYRDWSDKSEYLKNILYFYNIPITIRNHSKYVLTSSTKNKKDLYPYKSLWEISSSTEEADVYKLLYKLTNHSLMLNANEENDMYNIVLYARDEYGNLSCTVKNKFIKTI